MECNNYDKTEVVFIGDAISDRDAALNNEIEFIARIVPLNSSLRYEKNKMIDLRNLEAVIKNLSKP